MMSPPVTAVGLGEPLLANGNGGWAAVHLEKKKGGGAREDNKYWVDVEQPDVLLELAPDLENGSGERPPLLLLFRNKKVKRRILYPYRMLIFSRLIAVMFFFIWRIKNNTSDIVWLWAMSVAGDVWFGFSWLLNQLPKVNPIKSIPDLDALKQKCEGNSSLPEIDVFVTTASPVDEPILYTMNCILSILAVDYPVDKNACYLSDDAGALVQYEALVETAKFAALWVPFCRKYCVEPRAPESYFELNAQPHIGSSSPEDFIIDRKYVHREYDEFKTRIKTLPNTIRERSEAYNTRHKNSTLMIDGTQWPGAWLDPAENHKKGHHASIVQIIMNQPSHTPQLGQPVVSKDTIDLSTTDVRLPMLVYVSREKHPSYDHQKKAGAMNVQLRVSALLSNAPFIINFDCDHYINNSQSFRAAICFMLDPRQGENTAFVQFPQRFDNVDPTDRYCNHNRVFFDGTMLALNGLQGPSYLGTGCMFRRVALYGVDSPRRRAPGGVSVRANTFGNSQSFLHSMPSPDQEPTKLNETAISESSLADVMSCAYEVCTGWGDDVGWVYNIATEDIATGFRAHRQGWCSKFCTMKPDAFRGTAPINLTERLLQIMRWSGGSLELFFSHNNPLLARGWLHPMQRVAYLNMTIYPITSLFIVVYGLCPLMWLLPGEFYIQRPFTRYVLYVIVIILMVHIIGVFEIQWAGITWMDWWRNEQFFMIGATSAYPTAVLYMLVKLVTGKGIQFRITSKQTSADTTDDKFADLYVFRWVPLLIPTTLVFLVNVGAIGVALGKVVMLNGAWTRVQLRHAILGLVFNIWVMALLYPFALAMLGKRGKRPIVLFIVLPLAFVIVGMSYGTAHYFLLHFTVCIF